MAGPWPKPGLTTACTPAAFLNLGELRGHVAVARPVGFLDDDLDAGRTRDFVAFRAHRFAETAGAGDQRDVGEIASFKIGEDLLAGHAVGMRRLERPLAHGLDDLNGAGQRNERDLGLFEHRHHRQRRTGGAAADHGVDLVFFHQAGGEGARVIGVAGVVIDDQLQLLPVHAAFGVDLHRRTFPGFSFPDRRGTRPVRSPTTRRRF